MKNLLTDIAGVRVGHADDAALASGVTAVIFDAPAVAAIDVRGGGPGTREGAVLDLANTVERIDAHRACQAARRSGWRPAAACRRGSPNRAAGWRSRGARDPDRSRRDRVRPAERRRQEMGPFRAVPRTRLRRGRGRGHEFRARQRRRRAGRHHREFQGRPRLGLGGDAGRRYASRRLRSSMRSAASPSATGRGSGRRRSKSTANLADAACRRRSRRKCWRCG